MAKINKKGFLTGRIDNLVYREYNNQNIVQIKPWNVKQTTDTKIAAQEFGMASNAGYIIRQIGKLLYEYNDSNVSARLNGELLKCLRRVDKEPGERTISDIDPSPLTGFQFNLNAPFEEVFKAPLYTDVEPDGTVIVQQPGLEKQQIRYLTTKAGDDAGAFIRLALVGIDYTTETVQLLHQEECSLIPCQAEDFFQPLEEDWRCLKQLRKNQLVLLYGSLHYYRKDWLGRLKPLSDKNYNAAGILLAFKVDEQMHQLNRKMAQDQIHQPIQKPNFISSIQNDKIKEIAKIKNKQKKK